MYKKVDLLALSLTVSFLSACSFTHVGKISSTENKTTFPQVYGTQEPFSKEAVYFVVTDRFVDGDKSNNYPDQGGDFPTFDIELKGPNGETANIGYLGGDLQGVLDNAEYIKSMGFTAVWLTPILDNPDQAFSGGTKVNFGEKFRDGGKTGYHGYWATNFYKADEHLVSENLSFSAYTKAMKNEHGIKTVFDIVANHGSPSFSMPVDQPGYGEIYAADGTLVADHLNLEPEQLDTTQPLQSFFHNEKDLAELSNLNEFNPAVQDYLINAYLYWIEQGADAFRIDTIRHVDHSFWRLMSDRIRAIYPDFYMFGESFVYDANFIAQHTLPKNGAISVLDFPMQKAMNEVFSKDGTDFKLLADTLYLTHGPYNNVYDLTTFYDNHDMPRMMADDDGFINAHNWLFTVRGIPVIYQGSEVGFMRGTGEHEGNRNYFGQQNINAAPSHTIYQHLQKIAQVRKNTPALQRGLQVNIAIEGDHAMFYRVVQDEESQQIALVLLNKGDNSIPVVVSEYLQNGEWIEQIKGQKITAENGELSTVLAPNSAQVWVQNAPITNQALLTRALEQMEMQ